LPSFATSPLNSPAESLAFSLRFIKEFERIFPHEKALCLALILILTTLTVAAPLLQDPGRTQTQTGAIASDQKPIAEVKVPDGTEIEIQLKNNASGEELKVGDIVDFSVVRPVVVNGVKVFDKDASARARITTAKRAGHWGHAGKLEWAMQDVQAVDGNRVPARFTKRSIGDSKGGTVAVAAVATSILVGPFALLWGLKKGKRVIIPAGNRYSAFVSGDTILDPTKFPSAAIPTSSPSGAQPQSPVSADSSERSSIIVNSTPAGADIKINEKFVGNTPSTLDVGPGEHTIIIEKSGFKSWQRTISVGNGGKVTVEATLEKSP
jgi:hypothetical protein